MHCQQNIKTLLTALLLAGGTPRNGGTKVVHTRIDSTAGSESSAYAGGEVHISKAAPGRTFFDDVFNVISWFLYLFLYSDISFALLSPLPLDFSRFSLFSFPRPFIHLSFLSPYFLFSSPNSTFSSFVSFYFFAHPLPSRFPYSRSEGRKTIVTRLGVLLGRNCDQLH